MATAVVEKLARKKKLEDCIRIIQEALPTYSKSRAVIVRQLVIVRDERLYLETHRTFEDFLLSMEMSKTTAYRLIAEEKEPKPDTAGRSSSQNGTNQDNEGSNSDDEPETVTDHQPPPAPPKREPTKFDEMHTLIGKLVRTADDIARGKPGKPGKQQHEAFLYQCQVLKNMVTSWSSLS